MNNLAQTINTDSALPAAVVNPAIGSESQLDAIKSRMKATWMAGDYAIFSRYMEPGAKEILADWNISPGECLLDVGCGAGQTAIPAAQAGARVTGIDIATNLIEAARERAALEGVQVRFDEGDAEQIPYRSESFDVVISMIGAMFAPRPERVAAELARVCKPGARLCMANWTPQGMVGQMFKIVAKRIAPPAGVRPPVLWGDEQTVQSRLAGDFSDIALKRKYYPSWRYPFSASELVDFFRAHFGPINRAFAALDEAGKKSFHNDLARNFTAHNTASDGSVQLKAEYLEVVAARR